MDLGMGVTYLDPGSSQMGKKESIEDTARVLGRMYDGIEFRGFAQDDVEELAAKSGVPVWNGLTTEWHPTQMLADVLTMQANFNYDLTGRTVAVIADAASAVAGAPTGAPSVCSISWRRGPMRGSFEMTCTATFWMRQPAPVTIATVSVMNTSPWASRKRGSAVPNRAPMSPSPAAESSASQIA